MPPRIEATFALITLAALVLRWMYGDGFIASDDIGYAEFGARLAAGDFTPQPHHYWSRYGVTVPVAVMVLFFGLQEWITNAVPLIASTACVWLTMRIALRVWDGNTVVAIAAGLLYATFPVQLHNATTLLPEPLAEFFVLAAIYAYVHAGFRNDNMARPLRSLSVGALLGLAFLAKEPALFVLFALCGHCLATRNPRRAVSILAGTAAIGMLELAFHYAMTGDPFFRLHAMGAHEASEMARAANADLPYRLLKVYPRMMVVPDLNFGLHSLAALPLGILGWFALHRDRRWLFALWCVLPWLYLNFGSSSLTHYYALPSAPRYIEFLYPPLFLLAGSCLASIWSKGTAGRATVSLVLGTVCIAGVIAAAHNQYRNPTIATLHELRDAIEKARSAGYSGVDLQVPGLRPDDGVPDRWRRAARILAPDVTLRDDAPTVIEVTPDGRVVVTRR